jgi:C1A family cysteine protease
VTNPSRRPKPASKGRPASPSGNLCTVAQGAVQFALLHGSQPTIPHPQSPIPGSFAPIPGFSLHPSRAKESYNRPYGWRPEPRHLAARAFEPEVFKVAAPKGLPSHVSLQADCPPVYDQGKLGSCTANAIAAAIQVDLKRTRQKPVMPSRLYIYWNERAQLGTIESDVGASLQLCAAVTKELGCCPESLWPYNPKRFADVPTKKCFVEADKLRVSDAAYLDNTDVRALKRCLAAGIPFVFGLAIYESFERPITAASGLIPMPKPTEAYLGGHAMMAVGYDDQTHEFLVRNSWSSHWGIDGYCWIPYDYLTNPHLASDFWTIQTLVKK